MYISESKNTEAFTQMQDQNNKITRFEMLNKFNENKGITIIFILNAILTYYKIKAMFIS